MKDRHIAGIRAFNRFYTRIIGLLDQHILNSKYSLPEVRILYELYHRDALTASDIIASLGIDKGYLSRIIRSFEKKKLISKQRSDEDARSIRLCLTKKGRSEFKILDEASNRQLRQTLESLTDADCNRLTHHMEEIRRILSSASK